MQNELKNIFSFFYCVKLQKKDVCECAFHVTVNKCQNVKIYKKLWIEKELFSFCSKIKMPKKCSNVLISVSLGKD